MTEYIVRFLVGGAVVSAFAMLGDVLRPKCFAGLFGAAPSVALGDARHRGVPPRSRLRSDAKPFHDRWGGRARRLCRRRLPAPHSREVASGSGNAAVARRLAGRRSRPMGLRRRIGMTPIRFSSSSLREGRWYEYIVRFALGGAATVFTGLVSSRFGASIGGLFLALPAIFCASATLIEKHEIRRKREAALAGERRGRQAAALDAAGAALGALGLLAFAVVFSLLVESRVSAAFTGASLAWLLVSVAAWCARRKWRSVRRTQKVEEARSGAISRCRRS